MCDWPGNTGPAPCALSLGQAATPQTHTLIHTYTDIYAHIPCPGKSVLENLHTIKEMAILSGRCSTRPKRLAALHFCSSQLWKSVWSTCHVWLLVVMLGQRNEWFPRNIISNAVESEKVGELCPPGGDHKVNNHKSAMFSSSELNEKREKTMETVYPAMKSFSTMPRSCVALHQISLKQDKNKLAPSHHTDNFHRIV